MPHYKPLTPHTVDKRKDLKVYPPTDKKDFGWTDIPSNTETALVYRKTLELLEYMSEDELFSWVVTAPEEAAYFAYHTLNPQSFMESDWS